MVTDRLKTFAVCMEFSCTALSEVAVPQLIHCAGKSAETSKNQSDGEQKSGEHMMNFIDDVQWIYKQTDIRGRPFFWRFRFIARACAGYLNVAAWWEFVRSNIAPLCRNCCLDFFQQPLRPFYCRAYTTSQRAKLLVDTYRFLGKELENSVYEFLLNGGEQTACESAGQKQCV